MLGDDVGGSFGHGCQPLDHLVQPLTPHFGDESPFLLALPSLCLSVSCGTLPSGLGGGVLVHVVACRFAPRCAPECAPVAPGSDGFGGMQREVGLAERPFRKRC
jgi:hypothetical protein